MNIWQHRKTHKNEMYRLDGCNGSAKKTVLRELQMLIVCGLYRKILLSQTMHEKRKIKIFQKTCKIL